MRFADDMVILLGRNNPRKVLERIRGMLARLGLELHPEKTRIVDVREGFDFLGVHVRLCKVRKVIAKLKESCRIWPSDRSMERIRKRIREVIGRRYSLALEEMIEELNPVIRGWNNYHTKLRAEVKRF